MTWIFLRAAGLPLRKTGAAGDNGSANRETADTVAMRSENACDFQGGALSSLTTVFRSAAAAVTRVGASGILFCGDQKDARGATAFSPRTFRAFPLGIGSHTFHEICLVARGRAALRIGNLVLPLTPPKIAVIEPGQSHCEGVLGRHDTYDLVWVLANSPLSAYLVISSRDGRGRWTISSHHAARTRHAQQLVDILNSLRPPPSREGLDAFRSLLLAILGEAMLDAAWQRFLTPGKPRAADERLELLGRLKGVLETRLDQPLTVESLAELFHLTPNYLNHLFRQWTGEAIHAYLNRRRMEIAADLCRNSSLQIKQIALRVGFSDPLYFSRAFARHHGQSPQAVRRHSVSPTGALKDR